MEQGSDISGFFKVSNPEVFCKKGFLNILINSQKNTCAGVVFFNAVAGLGPATALKSVSSTGVS